MFHYQPAMTTAWGRLVVTFKGGMEVDLSVAEIFKHMKQIYDIGYVGLFVDDNHRRVFLQTSNLTKRMTPNKVSTVCSRFGNVTSVKKFSGLYGICMEQIGTFRKAGPMPGSKGAQPSPAKHTTGTSTPKEATPKKPKHTPVQQKDFCEEEEDPVFLPVYTGFGGDWKVVSWNRATKKVKRRDCTKFREQVLDGQDHKCNYCACNVSFGHYSNADVDHIIPLNAGGEQALSNVHVLCTPCHRRKTGLECQRFTTTLGAIMSVAYRPSERQDVGEVGSDQ